MAVWLLYYKWSQHVVKQQRTSILRDLWTFGCQEEILPLFMTEEETLTETHRHGLNYMKILKVKRASDHSEHETGLLMVSVFGTAGLIMWFNTHFTGVWSTAQRIIQRFKLIPARPAQNQPRTAFMKQSGTFWQTQDRDRIRGWQHCGEMPSQWRIHAMQIRFGQSGTLTQCNKNI